MIPSHKAEQAAIARQLLEALARYDRDLSLLVARGLDAELAQRVSEQFDLMRSYSTALPTLSVTWVELLISRFDMTHAMWSNRNGGTTHRVAKLHAYHRSIIDEARRKCGACIAAAALRDGQAPPAAPTSPAPL
ncbi:hypothetical protein [Ramlibacter albus]|uniref:Uncharacterized protein n=1 Tax=Ramlibacter albus TaxID=2079448 RepID=A0A923M5Z4_9BURK|nr:hypothetical protein [Ramlibacter albus]MBC5763319.1 hypothetical protein [Ramlibacter albus]